MINQVTKIAVNEIFKLIKKSYSKRPKETILGIFGFTIAIEYIDRQKNQIINPNIKIEERLIKLNEIQYSLKELGQFIENQKNDIVHQKTRLDNLKEENEELVPIVEANKELVNQIFKQQDKRNKIGLWLSLGLGFLFGILASFIGSILYSSYKKYRKNKPVPNSKYK